MYMCMYACKYVYVYLLNSTIYQWYDLLFALHPASSNPQKKTWFDFFFKKKESQLYHLTVI